MEPIFFEFEKDIYSYYFKSCRNFKITNNEKYLYNQKEKISGNFN